MSYEPTAYEGLVWLRRKLDELKQIVGEKLKSCNTIKEHIFEEASV
jgi:hypothetical protein